MENDVKKSAGSTPRVYEKVIGLKEVSEILGCSRVTVWRMVRDGQLEAFKVRDVWRTSIPAVEKYVRERYGDQAYECLMKTKR